MKNNSKGIILSFENESAVVLTPQGDFVKIPMKAGTHFIGEEVRFEASSNQFVQSLLEKLNKGFNRHSFRRRFLQYALSICMIFTAGIGSWAYPAGHIYMDVNPSLGFSYNIYHRVIRVETFNEDGAKVIAHMSLYGNTLEETLDKTILAIDKEGFIKSEDEDPSQILLGFTDPKLQETLTDQAIQTSAKLEKNIKVNAITVAPISEEIAEESGKEVDANKDETQKEKKEKLSPIEAEIAGQMIQQLKTISKDKKNKAEIKAEIKALGQKLKEEKALKEKLKPSEKPELKPKPEAKQKSEPRVTQKPEPKPNETIKDTLKTSKITEERLLKIDDEINRLTVLLEELKGLVEKDKKTEAQIKKLEKRIERLIREKEKLKGK